MPLCDFRCPACETVVELLVKSSEQPECPKCGAKPLERLISGVAPPGKSKGIAAAARRQAAREGHLSNFS